jgi:hypothetical protein
MLNRDIRKFLEYVDGLEMFVWTHVGDQPPDPDLVAAREYLEQLAAPPAPEEKP